MASRVKKELAKLKLYKPTNRLLLPPPKSSSSMSQVQEIVVAADIGCSRCQKRVAEAISRNIDEIESMVVHFAENEVTLTPKSSSTKVATLSNNYLPPPKTLFL